MKIYTKISEWLKDFPQEDSNEKLLKIINRKAEIEFIRMENKNKKNAERLKKRLAKKQKEVDKIMEDLKKIESGEQVVVRKNRNPGKPRQKKTE